MPRLFNKAGNAQKRAETRIMVIARDKKLRDMIRDTIDLSRSKAFIGEKMLAQDKLVLAAINSFSKAGAASALPKTRTSILAKLAEAWPIAVQIALAR